MILQPNTISSFPPNELLDVIRQPSAFRFANNQKSPCYIYSYYISSWWKSFPYFVMYSSSSMKSNQGLWQTLNPIFSWYINLVLHMVLHISTLITSKNKESQGQRIYFPLFQILNPLCSNCFKLYVLLHTTINATIQRIWKVFTALHNIQCYSLIPK